MSESNKDRKNFSVKRGRGRKDNVSGRDCGLEGVETNLNEVEDWLEVD